MSSSTIYLSLLYYVSSSLTPVIAIVLPFKIITVYLKWATNSPTFSAKTGYECNNSCFEHSVTASLAPVSSSNYLNEKARVGYFSVISAKNALAAFNFKLYALSIALL